MINYATFRIIGRIGNIHAREQVTHISIASDRQVKRDDDWVTETDWNTVTIFNPGLRKRLANAKVGQKGNLVIFEGSIQTNAYEKDDTKLYQKALVAQSFDVLAFKRDEQ
jgi:single-stranded DNA-binding protein